MYKIIEHHHHLNQLCCKFYIISSNSIFTFFISILCYSLNSNILEIKFFILTEISTEGGYITGCFRDSWKDFMV